jgi:GTPase involved in cell partitioning and DNA repair
MNHANLGAKSKQPFHYTQLDTENVKMRWFKLIQESKKIQTELEKHEDSHKIINWLVANEIDVCSEEDALKIINDLGKHIPNSLTNLLNEFKKINQEE